MSKQSTPAREQSSSTTKSIPSLGSDLRRLVTTPNLIITSFVIQLGLVLYANHVDSHPERYGGLRYTDVDWRVVTDGAKLIFGTGTGGNSGHGKRAEGWLIDDTGLPVGDPYERATFRYTPLLPLLLSSSVIHDLLGKITLILISLLVTPVLLAAGGGFWPTHLIWTLNPFVISITTRGSPEAIIVLLVVMLLLCLKNAESESARDSERNRVSGGKSVSGTSSASASVRGSGSEDMAIVWWTFSAVILGIAISWKIYPIIYVPAIWALLASKHGWLGGEVWWFGTVTAVTLVLVNWPLWSIWGQPFLDNTFLYHLSRLDHRHNFSPYYYQIYLSLFPSSDSPSPSPSLSAQGLQASLVGATMTSYIDRGLVEILNHPLISFLPQITLVGFLGFSLPRRIGIGATMFYQTAAFVGFNKVITSQYFIWFLPLLPQLIPSLHPNLSRTRTTILLSSWIAAQGIWLSQGYKLEFLGENCHLGVWSAGMGLFVVGCWVLGELLDRYHPESRPGLERWSDVSRDRS